MSNDVDSFLSGGGAPAAKFPTIGTTVRGTITGAEMRRQTDPATGKPQSWDDGIPKMQLVVTLATDERDASIEDDDGTRRVFVKSGAMRNAVRDALKAVGGKLEVGGKLAVQYTGDGEKTNPAFNAPKLYSAQYKAPELAPAAVGADELL